jgi:hypothetical protein
MQIATKDRNITTGVGISEEELHKALRELLGEKGYKKFLEKRARMELLRKRNTEKEQKKRLLRIKKKGCRAGEEGRLTLLR